MRLISLHRTHLCNVLLTNTLEYAIALDILVVFRRAVDVQIHNSFSHQRLMDQYSD